MCIGWKVKPELKHIKPFIFLLLFLVKLNLNGQIFQSKNFTSEDGLPGTEINDIKQDSLGRIWISSRNGIGAYDGMEWKIYDVKSGLINNSVTRLAIDSSGRIWTLGNSSNFFIAYLKNDKWISQVIPLASVHKPRTWISGFEIINYNGKDVPVFSIHGKGLFYLQNKKWVKLNKEKGLINNNVNSLVKRGNSIYICTDSGIQLFKNLKLKILREFQGINVLKISLDERTGNPAWLLTFNTLFKINGNKIIPVADNFKIGEFVHRFFDLSKEYFGLIFFGDSRSFYAYDFRENKLINFSRKLTKPINGVYRIFIDRERNIWIAYYYGVSEINSLALQSFYSSRSTYINVTSISQLDSQRIFIAADKKILVGNYKNKKFKSYSTKKLNGELIIDSYTDVYGQVWFAAVKKGFGKWSERKGIEWFGKIKDKHFAYSVTGNKKYVFLLTEGNLFRYNLKTHELARVYSNNRKNVFLRKVFINHRGEVVIATHGGGVIISNDLKEWRIYRSKSNDLLNDVFAYYKYPVVGEFVGTFNGLARINGDSLQATRLSGYDINSSVYLILKAKNGDLWLGTNRGVYRWTGASLIHYSTKMGLSGAETNRDAGLIDGQGNVWIGTDAGINLFDYRFDKLKITPPPRVFITGMESHQIKLANFSRKINLNYFDNELVIHFKAFSQFYPFSLIYQARLIGKDQDWIVLKNSTDPHLHYSNLRPGNYSFRVKAINFYGMESKSTIVSDIYIQLPFYRSWWFVALLTLFVFTILVLIASYMNKTRSEEILIKKVEEATKKLKESEEQYRHTFKENKAILLLADFSTKKIIDANNSAVNFYGYTVEELKRKTFTEIDESFDEIFPLIKEKQAPFNYRSKHRLSTGEVRSVEVFVSIIHTSRRTYIHFGVHDVTEQEKTKSDLLASEAKYQTIIENIQDGLFMLKGEMVAYVNNAFLQMTGFKLNEVLGKNYLEFVAPEDRNLLIERHKLRMEGKEVPTEYVFRLLHKDGTKIITNLHVGTFKLNDNVYIVGTLKNITENYKAQQALKESEERYKSLFENNTVGIYRTNPQGDILLVNQAMVDMLGFGSKEELMRINLEADNLPIVINRKEFVERIEKEGVVKGFETRMIRKDGKEIYVRESAKAFKDEKGKTLYYEGVIEDITQTKLAFEELRKSQKKLYSILNSMPDPMLEISPLGVILNVINSENLNDMLNKEIKIGTKLERVFQSKWKKPIDNAIRKAFTSSNYQTIKIEESRNDEKIYLELRILKIDSHSLLTLVRNITNMVNYENALIAAKEAAEESDRLKSEFLAQMSHEIRTPLNAIMSFTQLLEEEFYNKVDNDQKIIFDSIKRGSNRLINTIELLIHTAEVQVGSYEPNFEELDLNSQILKEIVEELRPLARRKKLELTYKFESQNAIIMGDRFSVSQIFINLIGNAIKYTNTGGVNIRVYDSDDGEVTVDIEDTGIGISEDFLPYLFKPFSQEEAGYTRKFEGTGLGLSLVKNYIEINKGTISVKSKKGFGSTFTVKFKKIIA